MRKQRGRGSRSCWDFQEDTSARFVKESIPGGCWIVSRDAWVILRARCRELGSTERVDGSMVAVMRRICLATVFLGLVVCRGLAGPVDEGLVEVLLAVGSEGKGNAEASAAVRKIVESGDAGTVPGLLAAMNRAGVVPANWIRGAVSSIAAKTDGKLPAGPLEAFARDTGNRPAGRILAMELLRRSDEAVWERLIPAFLDDPSAELRREPVARLLASAKGAGDAGALRKALGAARDEDQIREAADALREKGETVDLPAHFGFVMEWQVAGPFENDGRRGFATEFPPEKGFDATAVYEGKPLKAGEPNPVRWKPAVSADQFGLFDCNKAVGMIKEATAYAHAVFESAEERDAEIRLGCKNAWKVWLNGELLFARDEYHRGREIDQYRMPVRLKQGANQILVKCCQNEQTETWTVEWEFQLRVCDATGTPVLAVGRAATPPAALGVPEKSAKD
jgi:hypothetical protein